MTKIRKFVAMVALPTALVISAFFLKIPFSPFIWIGFSWLASIVLITWAADSYAAKLIGIHLCAVVATVTLFECYLWWASPVIAERYEGIYEENFMEFHPFLGYAAHPNLVLPSAKRYYGNSLVYDVTYTMDNNGNRITGNRKDHDGDDGSIIFFGCSYTFGEGVNDEESMPFQVALLSDKFNVHNFGFPGYGPHQMLSALEHGLVADIVDNKNNVHFVYQYMPHHVNRASGLASWDSHGPKFTLGADGDAVYSGQFDDGLLSEIAIQLEKSLTYRKIFGTERKLRSGDVDLFVAIVRKSARIAGQSFPGSSFDVIGWGGKGTDQVLLNLERFGIQVHWVEDILPNYSNSDEPYTIVNDGHPNAIGHRLISRYVINEIADTKNSPN